MPSDKKMLQDISYSKIKLEEESSSFIFVLQ
jgi:hypothetical protein